MTCDEINLNILESVATEFWRFSTGLSDALFCSNRKCSLWISNTCSFILKTIWWAWSTISRGSVMNMTWRAKQQKQIPRRLVSNVVQTLTYAVLKKEVYKREERAIVDLFITASSYLLPQVGFRFHLDCEFSNGMYICLVIFLCQECFPQILFFNPYWTD